MKAVVIGAGAIAKQHLAALRRLPTVEAAAVCDLSPAMAEAATERFGVAKWYTDYHQMLDEVQPDVAHITTPAPTHLRIATDCLRAGAHAFVEKPITGAFNELETLIAEAEAADRWVLEDYNYLFNRDIEAIQARVADGRLGRVRHVEIRIHLGIFGEGSRFADRDVPHPAIAGRLGAAGDFITHMVYLANAFVELDGVGGVSLESLEPEAPSPDSLLATLRGRRGFATLAFDAYSQPDQFLVRVHGTKEVAETNLFERGGLVTRNAAGLGPLAPVQARLGRGFQEFGAATKSLARKLSGGPGAYEGLWRLVELVYERLEAGKAPPVEHDQIQAVNRLVEQVSERGAAACVS